MKTWDRIKFKNPIFNVQMFSILYTVATYGVVNSFITTNIAYIFSSTNWLLRKYINKMTLLKTFANNNPSLPHSKCKCPILDSVIIYPQYQQDTEHGYQIPTAWYNNSNQRRSDGYSGLIQIPGIDHHERWMLRDRDPYAVSNSYGFSSQAATHMAQQKQLESKPRSGWRGMLLFPRPFMAVNRGLYQPMWKNRSKRSKLDASARF